MRTTVNEWNNKTRRCRWRGKRESLPLLHQYLVYLTILPQKPTNTNTQQLSTEHRTHSVMLWPCSMPCVRAMVRVPATKRPTVADNTNELNRKMRTYQAHRGGGGCECGGHSSQGSIEQVVASTDIFCYSTSLCQDWVIYEPDAFLGCAK